MTGPVFRYECKVLMIRQPDEPPRPLRRAIRKRDRTPRRWKRLVCWWKGRHEMVDDYQQFPGLLFAISTPAHCARCGCVKHAMLMDAKGRCYKASDSSVLYTTKEGRTA